MHDEQQRLQLSIRPEINIILYSKQTYHINELAESNSTTTDCKKHSDVSTRASFKLHEAWKTWRFVTSYTGAGWRSQAGRSVKFLLVRAFPGSSPQRETSAIAKLEVPLTPSHNTTWQAKAWTLFFGFQFLDVHIPWGEAEVVGGATLNNTKL